MTESKRITIDIQPLGRRIDISPGDTLLDASRSAGAGLISLCGGDGWCKSCQVRIIQGSVNPPSEFEIDVLGKDKIDHGVRLACRTKPLSDIRINIPPDSLSTPQRLQLEGKANDVGISPSIIAVNLALDPPNLSDLRDDTTRITETLTSSGHGDCWISQHMMMDLSGLIRKYDWSARFVLHDHEIIAVLPSESRLYGVAVDIGTTKIALYLVDLVDGKIISKHGMMNPQIAYGEDLISRISYTQDHPDGRTQLQAAVVDTLNSSIREFSEDAGIKLDQIVDFVVVGNTAMHHLFIGLPVDQLVFAPFIPSLKAAVNIQSKNIGINIAPGAHIYFLPNIAGYVGADHSAVILSTELWITEETIVVIDIGTNTEISLIYQGKISCCSCASGPAFEGAHIKHGMRAASGAIERVKIKDNNDIVTYTIDDQPPVGICGSGILDIVAEFRKKEWINEKGAWIGSDIINHFFDENSNELLLVPSEETGNNQDITISRADINEIQLAKAAIRAGLDILVEESGITAGDIDRVIIAGAFGTYINIQNAIDIGMFPRIPVSRFQQVGNAAGMGAVRALISTKQRDLISDVVKDVEYIELTTYENFQDIYLRSMYLH